MVVTNGSKWGRLKDGSPRALSELYWAVIPFLGMIFVRSFVRASDGWFVLLLATAALAFGTWYAASAVVRKRYSADLFMMPIAVGIMFLAGAVGWIVRQGGGTVLALILGVAALVVVLAVPVLPRLNKAGVK
jgi:hypothetical protein